MSHKFTIGLDVGYSNLKAAYGPPNGHVAMRTLPAGAGRIDDLPHRIGNHNGDDQAFIVLVGDQKWAAGIDQARLETTVRQLHGDYTSSDAYRALFYAALVIAEQTSITQLITGLPVSHYFDDGREVALRAWMTGSHQVTPKRTVTVETVLIVPQPMGAYFDLLTTHEDPALLGESRLLVLDAGFYSFDWITMVHGELRKATSGTSKRAMSMVLETLNHLIQADHGGTPGVARLEQAIRHGRTTVPVYGDPVPLAPYLAAAQSKVATDALTELKQQMRALEADVDVILIVGGGAPCYHDAARTLFPKSKIIVPDQPVLANARGFWHAGNRARP